MSAQPTEGDASAKRTLPIVFLTLFIDLVGFSIIFPLFPALMAHYLPGAAESGGWLAGVTETLRGWAPGEGAGAEHLTAVLFGGLLGTLYSGLQFLTAPLWGRLSDRVGRRPVLLLTIGGIALSYLIWMLAGNFWLFIIARVLGGVMAGNLSVATAAVADVTDRRNRSKGMALVGIAFGLGLIFGPALGALFSLLNPLDWQPGLARFGLNPFSAAAGGALLLSLLNLLWVWRAFKETRPASDTPPETARERPPRLGFLSGGEPPVRRTNWVNFFYLVSFSGMEFSLAFLAAERFGFSPVQNGLMLVFVGFVLILVQGGLVRRLAPRYGERPLVLSGLAGIALAFAGIALASGTGGFFLALALLGLGVGLASPTLSALVSLYSSDAQQGENIGLFRSAGSLGRALGPLLGAALYFSLGSSPAYLIAAAFMLLPLALAVKLPQPAAHDSA